MCRKRHLGLNLSSGPLYPDNHYLIYTHLKVLRMGPRRGWILGDRSICPLKPPRAPHLRASRPGSRRLPGFRPRPGLASPLMPLSPPPPLRPRFPDPLPVSSSGTGGSGELWGGAKALRGGRAGSGSRAEVGLSGGRQGASGCSGGICRQNRSLSVSMHFQLLLT